MKFVHTADTHLGFEITRIKQGDSLGRQNRADSIFQNFLEVIQHTIQHEADLFIHSGDLFNKAYIPGEILEDLVHPIRQMAKKGIRVLIIPGNHEKSEFPFELFYGTRNVFVFDIPKSISLEIEGTTVAISGFPFIRKDSKRSFFRALEATDYQDLRADMNILVTHQAFDQATVGPSDFTFRPGRWDTVERIKCPTDFDYIAAGHIHRYQILSHPLKPDLKFVYSGSTQRMSFAEMYEEKGFVEGEVINNRIETHFIPLPAYDMEIVRINATEITSKECEEAICDHFWRFNKDLVIRYSLMGGQRLVDYPAIDFERLRSDMPPILECQFAVKTSKKWVFF